MKNLKYIVLLAFFGLFSCEDVIEVDLPTAPPRLVVDASIDWVQGTDGSIQKIKLTTTTDYYNSEIPTVSNAIISIENEDGLVFDFVEEGTSGEYFCYDFIPEIGKSYTLTLIVEGEVYTATETLYSTPEILYFTQSNDIGFGDDIYEIRYYFQDNPNENNFYIDRVQEPNVLLPDYGTMSDKFTQGNQMYGLYFSDELKPGDVLDVRLYAVSERHYDYMNKLLEVANAGGGPFQTNSAVVRGNLINQTNPDNYALGYFRLLEIVEAEYVVE